MSLNGYALYSGVFQDSIGNKKHAVYLYSEWYSKVLLAKHGCIGVAAIVCAFKG